MTDWIVKLYRKMNTTARRAAVLLLAFVIAMSTLHFMTFPATALTRKAGENDPGIVIGDETNTEGFDNASEGDNTEVNPVNTETNPAEEETITVIPEGETPAPADTTVDAEPTPEPTEPAEPTETPDGNEEAAVIVEPTATPEVTPTPEPTETPAAEEEPEEESDPTADVETATDWENLFRDVELTGVWADDLLTLAELQKGYKESAKNFVKDDEGKKYGYTRYGEWYGDPYAEWDSLFVMFNLYYAGITKLDFPYQADCEDWIDALKDAEMFHEVNTYVPNKGDLVFADVDEDNESDHVPSVKAVEKDEAGNPDKLIVIEGNIDNEVKESTYEFYNPLITGFAQLPENPLLEKEEAEAVEDVEAVEEEIETVEEETEPEMLSFIGSANQVEVTVLYEKGAFPEGTTMDVTTVGSREVIDSIKETVSEENKSVSRVQAVDIIFRNPAGEEIQPEGSVRVTMKSKSVPKSATEAPTVVHVDNVEGPEVITDTAVPEDEPEDTKGAVTFEAESFSVYAIVYTVDFEYEDEAKVYKYSIKGEGSIALSELLNVLGIQVNLDEILDVSFSDESLLSVRKAEESSDWILTSLAPFHTEESLVLYLNDGSEIAITVKDAQYVTNINNLLTNAKLTLNGQEVQDGETINVRENTKVDLQVQFAENDDFQFSNDGTLTYKLPDGFVLPDGFETNITLDLGLDGKLFNNHLTYNRETNTITLALNTASLNYESFTASGTAQLKFNLNGYFDFTQTQVKFSEDLTVIVNREDPHDANVTKEGSYDKETQTMTYTVRVTADGTVTNLNVSDHMDGTALTYVQGSVRVKSDERPASAGERTNQITLSENSGFDAVIPDMVDGEVVTFEYKAQVDPSKISQSGNATVEEMGNTVRIYNDKVDKNVTHVYHNIEVSNIDKNAVRVSPVYEEDGKKYQDVTWEIVTNDPPEVSMAGSTITDTITGAMVGNTVYNDDIQISVYDANGQQVGDTRTPSLSELGVTDPQNQKSWTYTIPESDTGKYKYVVRYSTKVDVTYVTGTSTAMNTTTGKGGTDTGTAPVGQNKDPDDPTPDDGLSVSKQNLKVTEEEVEWAIPISVKAKEGGYSSFVVTEIFPNKATGNEGFIDPLKVTDPSNLANNIDVSGLHEGETYTVEYLPPYTNDAYRRSGKDTIPSGIKITFKKADGSEGLIADTDRVITIKLTTLNDKDWLEYALNSTDPEWNKHYNTGDLNGTHNFDALAMPMKKVIHKVLHNTESGIDYTYDPAQGPIKVPQYEFRVSVGGVNEEPLDIEDTFNTDLFMLNPNKPISVAGGSHKTDPGPASRGLVEETDYTNTAEGLSFSISDLPKDNGSYYGYYIITYYLIPKSPEAFAQIKREAAKNNGQATYQNIAALDEDNKSSADFSYNYKILDKKAEARDGYVIYTIDINKDKLTLKNGENMELIDTYSKNQTIDFSTIIVTTDPAENKSSVSYDFSEYQGKFVIPDATHVIIQYTAKPVGDGEQILTNEASMEDYFDDSGETKVVSGGGEGSADTLRIRVFKYERGHMEGGLNGAVFRLLDSNKQPILDRTGNEITFATSEVYMYTKDVPETDELINIGIAGKKKDVIETASGIIETLNRLYPNHWIFDPNYGVVRKVSGFANIFLNEQTTGAYLKKDTRYYLEEIQPATADAQGQEAYYKLPTFLYSFMISDHPDYANYVYSNNDVMTARNDRDTGGLDIVKRWGGSAELTEEQKANIKFKIEVLGSDGVTWEPYTHSDAYPNGEIPYTSLEDDAVHLDNVPLGKYRVTETNAEVEEYTLVTTYEVDGHTPKTETEVFDITSTEKGHSVIVTNKYDVQGYEFIKVDGNATTTTLPGAVFSVMKVTADNPEGELFRTYTTGNDGKFIIKHDDTNDSGARYETGVLYYVKETSAPRGYEIGEDKKFYFYLNNTVIPDYDKKYNAVNLTTDGGRETVTNEKGEISVTKEWKNSSGATIPAGADKVTVTLRRYTMIDPIKTVNIQLTGRPNEAGEKITFPELKVNNGNGVRISWQDSWYQGDINKVTVNGVPLTDTDFKIIQFTQNIQIIELSRVTEDLNLDIVTNTHIDTNERTYSAEVIGDTQSSSTGQSERQDDAEFSRTVELNPDKEWKHSWKVTNAPGDNNVAKTDEEGNLYYYYVYEIHVEGFETTYVNNGGINTGDIKIINTGTGPSLGSLTVTKAVSGDDVKKDYKIAVKDENNDYFDTEGNNKGKVPFYITFKKDVSQTWSNLPEGKYTLVESNEADAAGEGYDWSVPGTSGSVTVTAGATATATVTNTYVKKPGNLQLTKKVSGEGADVTKEFEFTISLTAPSDGTLADSYPIKMKDDAVPEGITYAKGSDGKTASISGIKLKANDVITIEGLPAGTKYVINESDYSEDGYSAQFTKGSHEGTITGGTTKTDSVEVTNTHYTGSLTVQKEISGTGADANEKFEFKATFTRRNSASGAHGTYTIGTETHQVVFTDGVAVVEFELKGGEEAVFEDIQKGARFEVEEISADQNGYETSVEVTGQATVADKKVTGNIDSSAAITVAYTNSRGSVDLNLIKVDETNTDKKLDGAVFEIQKVKEELTSAEPVNDEKWSYEESKKRQTTANGGNASFEKLISGYYKITEVSVPKGYILDGDDKFFIKVDGESVTLVKPVQDETTEKWTWQSGTENRNVTLEALTATVKNSSGSQLPKTGGSGTGMITILGSILILLGAGVLLLRRRKESL